MDMAVDGCMRMIFIGRSWDSRGLTGTGIFRLVLKGKV